MTKQPLAGLGVLVTRPEPEGEALAAALTDAGASPWRLPAVEIRSHGPEEDLLDRARASLDTALFVFVSRNAVRFGLPALGGPPARALAVGPATAAELAAAGVTVVSESGGFDSEALLKLDLLADPLDGEVWIVRGVGGRALLGDTLAARGASVSYLEVYRRAPPAPEPAVLAETLAAWRHGGIGVVTATSVEILDNLRNLLGSEYADLLSGTPLVTASERVVQRAAETGHRADCVMASAPGDADLVSALADWHSRRSQSTGNAAMNENKQGPEEPGHDEAAVVDDAAAADSTQEPGTPAGGGKGLAATALVVALAGAGASGFHWWQSLGQGEAVVSEAARLEGSVNRVSTGLQDLDSRLTSLERSAGAASRRLDDLKGSLQADLARLGSRDRELESRLATAVSREPAAEQALGPMLAETEYLLRVAARSVSLAARPDVAAAALQAADANLAELDDPRLQPVREQIADDLTALSAAGRPDTAGVAMRLGSLASRVDSLPLDPDLAPEGTDFGRPMEDSETGSGWNRLVGKVKGFFSDLFRVRAVEGDIRPVLATEEAFFLYRNLELDLKTARLAALSEDPAGYREALRAARGNLERYFDTSDPAVEGVLDTLGELEGQEIETRMPDVSGSLAAFQALGIDATAGIPDPGDTGQEQPAAAEPPSLEAEGAGAESDEAPETETPVTGTGATDAADEPVEPEAAPGPEPDPATGDEAEVAGDDAGDAGDDAGPAGDDAGPAGDDAVPAGGDAGPAGDDAVPAGDEAEAGGDDSTPPSDTGAGENEGAPEDDAAGGPETDGSETPAGETDEPADDDDEGIQAVGLSPAPGRT